MIDDSILQMKLGTQFIYVLYDLIKNPVNDSDDIIFDYDINNTNHNITNVECDDVNNVYDGDKTYEYILAKILIAIIFKMC